MCTGMNRRVLIIVVLCVLVVHFPMSWAPTVMAQTSELLPSSIEVHGSVTDNYANLTYCLVLNNTASSVARELLWTLPLEGGLRLSNVSVVTGGVTYWGRLCPESSAVEEYNETVAQNKTGVLVIRTGESYVLRVNVENGTSAYLSVFVEGLLTRTLGVYTLDMPLRFGETFSATLGVNLTVVSHLGEIRGYSVAGVDVMDVTAVQDGFQFGYHEDYTVVPSQLSLTYVLDRHESGARLLTYDNGSQRFFAYLLAPTIVDVSERLPRQYIFVIDVSGSMGGVKIDQAKTALKVMVHDLRESDTFNVVSFARFVYSVWSTPRTATVSNVAEAESWIDDLVAHDSTNFYGGCMTSIDMFTADDSVKVMFVLSDGLPTVGETTDADEIMDAVRSANKLGVSVSTVAFGSGADMRLMTGLAMQNGGYFALVEPTDDAATELVNFYRSWATPFLRSYSIEVDGASEVVSLRPLDSTPFFNGSEIVVSGRYSSYVNITTVLEYATGVEVYSVNSSSPVASGQHVEYMWAQQHISELVRMAQVDGETPSMRSEIVGTAMYYGLVVPGYTAIVLTAYSTTPETDQAGYTYSNTYTCTTTTAGSPSLTPTTTTASTTSTTDHSTTTTSGAPSPGAASAIVSPAVALMAGGAGVGLVVIVLVWGRHIRRPRA